MREPYAGNSISIYFFVFFTDAGPSWQEAASLKGRGLLVPHRACTSCRVAEVPRAALLAGVAV